MIHPHCRNWAGGLFLTDGGIETTLIFHEGWPLPYFAAFDLLQSATGTAALYAYYARYAAMASACGLGFVLESPTWRASSDWGDKLGYSAAALAAANGKAIALMARLREAFAGAGSAMVISGCVGPRGDGYDPGSVMGADEAGDYHRAQIGGLCASGRRHGDGHHHDQRQRGRGGRTRGRSRRPARRRLLYAGDRRSAARPGRAWPRRSRRWIRRPGTAPATT